MIVGQHRHPAPCQGQVISAPAYSPYVFVVQACTLALSTKNCLLSSINCFDCSGVSSSVKIAFTGHTGSPAPPSIHSSGCMKSLGGPSLIQWTRHTPTHA